MVNLTKEQIKEAISKTDSMLSAAAFLNHSFSTFKRHAVKYDLYKTNQGLIGKPKNVGNNQYDLTDVLNGKHPQYSTFRLKHRLYKANILFNKCEICGISSWQDKEINCELDHIDGNKYNHMLDNLRILCPNCHSQTSTFRSKKRK